MICSWCHQDVLREVSMLELLCPLLIPSDLRCQSCEDRLERIDWQVCCSCCGQRDTQHCSDCQEWTRTHPDFVFDHRGIFAYNEGMKEWLHQYKLVGDYRLRNVLATDVKKVLKAYRYDQLIPIPLSTDRYKSRGFNQVTAVLDAAGLSYEEHLLKPMPLAPLAALSKKERMAIPQPFSLKKGAAECIMGKKILLVDDVYTTGRTLYHAAALIHSCQPASVQSISFAR